MRNITGQVKTKGRHHRKQGLMQKGNVTAKDLHYRLSQRPRIKGYNVIYRTAQKVKKLQSNVCQAPVESSLQGKHLQVQAAPSTTS